MMALLALVQVIPASIETQLYHNPKSNLFTSRSNTKLYNYRNNSYLHSYIRGGVCNWRLYHLFDSDCIYLIIAVILVM